jgi:allophanate hydrolase subunit 2
VTRDQLIRDTRRLIAEGERLQLQPTMDAMRTWLAVSDALLAEAWGSMDRYHLAWLMVGRSVLGPRGRPMTPDETIAYVRNVADQKTAALRMSLKAVEEQNMPFLGESTP